MNHSMQTMKVKLNARQGENVIPEKPLISVITVALNSADTICKTIESVLNQTYSKVEYIIIDGDSGDNTVEMAAGYKERFESKGYIYKIISHKDSGMYHALNEGVQMATGDIIGQINSNDWYEACALEEVAKKFTSSECDYLWADLNIIKDSGSFVKKAKMSNFLTSRNWNHPTTFLKADIYKANPYRLKSMHDDFELFLRLKKQNIKFAVINIPLANFTFGGMSNKKSLKAVFTRTSSRWNNYKDNGYSFIYYIDSFLMELIKYIVG